MEILYIIEQLVLVYSPHNTEIFHCLYHLFVCSRQSVCVFSGRDLFSAGYIVTPVGGAMAAFMSESLNHEFNQFVQNPDSGIRK